MDEYVLDKWFSNFTVHKNHVRNLDKMQILIQHPDI